MVSHSSQRLDFVLGSQKEVYRGKKKQPTNSFSGPVYQSASEIPGSVSMQILNWLLTSQNLLRAHVKLPNSAVPSKLYHDSKTVRPV